MTLVNQSLEQLAVNTIRTLSIDAIDQANSGHPGLPMGAAPMAYVLWSKIMKHNPDNPNWFDRDRFILSAGHGSMLLYSLLHLCGYPLSLDEIKRFRQWGSLTPGHPEYRHTPGVEATTGPLGQGIGMAVGEAMAERHLAVTYNRPGHTIVDHYTYALCGDGDLMEGVSAEAASLAGHQKLGRLIVLYDSNNISLDGETNYAFTENVGLRFEAYGWQVLEVDDGNDLAMLEKAIQGAQEETTRPSLIKVQTVIGYGSPNKAGQAAAHGAPLGREETLLTKEQYTWNYAENFYIPEEVRHLFQQVKERGQQNEAAWNETFLSYKKHYPQACKQFERAIKGRPTEEWEEGLPLYIAGGKKLATRSASGEVLNAIAQKIPFWLGGSADLASSNKTTLKNFGIFQPTDYRGRNIWFGVREHAMGAILNGMTLHGGVRVYGGTFLVFSDYFRPAIRLAALMQLPVVYVLTHDSIAVGEDGPTHEPVEQLPSLRAIPGLTVIRPADANETVAAYRYVVNQAKEPVALILSRQDLPVLEGTAEKTGRKGMELEKGAYILSEEAEDIRDPSAEHAGDQPGEPKRLDGILVASGSEVVLVMEAQKKLQEEGLAVRVVSMPSWELFERQRQDYKNHVFPPHVKTRLAVEMAHPLGWERYTGDRGGALGITQFGTSAPGEKVVEAYGFTVENVVKTFRSLL